MRAPALLATNFIDDESTYAAVAVEMAHGGLPYVSAVERKPPLLFYVYAQVLKHFGDYNARALHVGATLCVLLTMLCLYLCARCLWDELAGLSAAGLYGIFVSFGVFRNLAWNGEMLMNLPLACAFWLALRPDRSPWRPSLLAASMLTGLAALLKQPAAIDLPALVCYVLLPSYRSSRRLHVRHVVVHVLWLGLGFAGVLGGAAWLLWRLGILEEAVFWSIGHHDVPHGPLHPIFWQRALGGCAGFSLACLPLLAASWLGLRRSQSHDLFAGREAERGGLCALLVASSIGTAASGRFYPHYFIQLVLPLALVAAPYAAHFCRDRQRSPAQAVRFTWARRYMIAHLLIVLGTQTWTWKTESSPSALIQYLRAHAGPGRSMFVWGQASYLYVESHIRPASRYVATFPLNGYIFGSPLGDDPRYDTSNRIVPGSWEHLAQELRERPPDFIVDADGARPVPRYPIRNYPLLRAELESFQLKLRDPQGLLYARATHN